MAATNRHFLVEPTNVGLISKGMVDISRECGFKFCYQYENFKAFSNSRESPK